MSGVQSVATSPIVQSYRADYGGYWPRRDNGWYFHGVLFHRHGEELTFDLDAQMNPVFSYDEATGRVVVLRDNFCIEIEVWWKGRAPWAYHYLYILKNRDFSYCFEEPFISSGKDRNAELSFCTLTEDQCNVQHRHST
jgi:hypothetical protein